MTENTQKLDKAPCIARQFTSGRFTAKDTIFPDRFADEKTLLLLDNRCKNSRLQEESCEQETLVGSFFTKQGPSVSSLEADQHVIQQEGMTKRLIPLLTQGDYTGTRSVPASADHAFSISPCTKNKKRIQDENDFCTSRDASKICLKEKTQRREVLQKQSKQAIFSCGQLWKPKEVLWIQNLEKNGSTKVRMEREKMRDLPHAKWASEHQRHLQFCAAHREACLENLLSRRIENWEMETYCQFPHCRVKNSLKI